MTNVSSFTTDLIVRVTSRQVRGRTIFVIEKPFQYAVGSLENPTEIINIERGYETDFVSIPMCARLFINNVHRSKAAVVHDFLLSEIDAGRSPRTAKEADRILREALRILGANVIERNLYYYSVRMTSMLKQLLGCKLA